MRKNCNRVLKHHFTAVFFSSEEFGWHRLSSRKPCTPTYHKQILKQIHTRLTRGEHCRGRFEVNRSITQPQTQTVNEPSGQHSDQVRWTVHSMLWHADIQNLTVDVTFRRKATGFGITSKNRTNKWLHDPKSKTN